MSAPILPSSVQGATGCTVGMAPAGEAAMSLLHQAFSSQATDCSVPGVSCLCLRPQVATPIALDVLLVAHHSLVDEQRLRHLRPGGTVLLLGEDTPALAPAARDLLDRAEARVLWQRPLPNDPVTDETYRAYVIGGLRAASAPHAELAAADSADADALRRGADAVGLLADQGADAAPEDPGAGRDEAADGDWQQALRRFHVTGHGAASGSDPAPGLPLHPALLCQSHQHNAYPLVFGPEGPTSFDTLIAELIDEDQLVATRRPGLTEAVGSAAGTGFSRPLVEVFAEAREVFARTLDLSAAAAAQLTAELDGLASRLPAGPAIGLGRGTVIELLLRAESEARQARVPAFRQEIEDLIHRLEERLEADAGQQGDSNPERLAAAFGAVGPVDVSRLASRLPARRGSVGLGDHRRGRIETALGRLRQFLEGEAEALPDAVVLHAPGLDVTDIPHGMTSVQHTAAIDAAAGVFDRAAQQMVGLFGAIRTAQLELRDAYRAEYDEILQRLDWQGLHERELAVMPPVYILETAQRVLEQLSSLSAMLRARRPVHLIVMDDGPGFSSVSANGDLSNVSLGRLAAAHRQALVVQATLAQPEQLYRGLVRVAGSTRPSVAVISVPDWDSIVQPARQLAAAHDGRLSPCFLYDPDAGDIDTARYDTSANPQPDQSWPGRTVDTECQGTGLDVGKKGFTFAHAAAQAPACRAAFRVIPDRAWADEQVPIADYLLLTPEERSSRIPYLWTVRNDGTPARAIMTRAMAQACRDVLQEWRDLQELARPVAATNESQGQETPVAPETPPSTAQLDQVRSEASRQAIERLARALVSVDGISAPALLQPEMASDPARPTPPAQRTSSQEGSAEATVSPPPTAPAKAFIDSALCTSCNDCINLNPKMFQYNADKQAMLADPSAGTYAQLVRAAEACPARCIFPGTPRADDDTVTPQLLERGQTFV